MKTKNDTFSGTNGNDIAGEGPAGIAPAAADGGWVGSGSRWDRRSFVKGMTIGGAMLLPLRSALADTIQNKSKPQPSTGISDSDADILRFLAAAEIIETDLWQQYTDFALMDGPFADALEVIDDDMPTYTEQNTNDEFSHQDFLNAFLVKNGKAPVTLEQYRTLDGSPVASTKMKRLTNLKHLNVDTSWYLRYRSAENPDLGAKFGQAVTIVDRPGIPVKDQHSYTANQMQAIANTAAFHFAMLEQGGSSLYTALSLGCATSLALKVVASIGGTEVAHFEIWNDKAGDAPPVDSGDGLVFPDLNANSATTTSRVMPRPCKFISNDLPLCSVIRPSLRNLAGATATIQFLIQTGLFHGQSPAFVHYLNGLAAAADAARDTDD